MVFNATSGNLYSIEATCRKICSITSHLCTVFAVYDFCKDMKEGYLVELEGETLSSDDGKEPGVPYWYIAGSRSLSTDSANSALMIEMLERM